jgi:serine/threonine protein kinase
MIGKTVASGRYELATVLGEGAQGTTFEAIDREQGKRVAIKRFSVRGAKSWKDVELAEREASVLSSLSHPNLPKYLAHFEEDGALYLVMDRIEGASVAELMRRGVVLERGDVMRFLADAAGVLGYLRDRAPPVIHRDINPKNVIRRPDGSFVVVDFGAVRDRLKVQGSTVVGTFGYMAP